MVAALEAFVARTIGLHRFIHRQSRWAHLQIEMMISIIFFLIKFVGCGNALGAYVAQNYHVPDIKAFASTAFSL